MEKYFFNSIKLENKLYKLWADFTCRLKILSDTQIGHEENHHRQQFVYGKKRDMKQREKEIVSEEEEMKENFIESQEESKEFILNNCEQGENDSFLDQIRIYNLEELFENIQEKFQKDIKKVVAENRENIEGMQN